MWSRSLKKRYECVKLNEHSHHAKSNNHYINSDQINHNIKVSEMLNSQLTGPTPTTEKYSHISVKSHRTWMGRSRCITCSTSEVGIDNLVRVWVQLHKHFEDELSGSGGIFFHTCDIPNTAVIFKTIKWTSQRKICDVSNIPVTYQTHL